MVEKIVRSEEEWKKILAPEEYRLLRQSGTEPAFDNAFWDNHKKGVYTCAGCDLGLFSSDTKFESRTGWPSFWAPIAPDRVETKVDNSFGIIRQEVKCARCGGHLGHVFNDGPRPTGLRYCMNSGAMHFKETK